MTSVVASMIKSFGCKNPMEYKNAVKEIVQGIILCGLSRAGFFSKAILCEGCVLRTFYGLDSFTSSMNFLLKEPDTDFSLPYYLTVVRSELNANGFSMTSEKQETTFSRGRGFPGFSLDDVASKAVDSSSPKIPHVASAVSALSAISTQPANFSYKLKISPNEPLVSGVAPDENILIFFEVYGRLASGATYDVRYILLPSPYSVCVLDLPSLFARSIYNILGRPEGDRFLWHAVYEYVWFVSHSVSVNMNYLNSCLEHNEHNGGNPEGREAALENLKAMLELRFKKINFHEAKGSLRPFVEDQEQLGLWSFDFFESITKKLSAV
ncbi:hypothetical protein HRQ91_02015 [Treponema parvum]|uniref:Uncharacterized protein n=1 Tax=Treponema parvum TaxID=138851 RepID=A0A975F2T2_9SPIR|nr:hypothetical protein [Treponema parvum]QTQ13328.1 hypothetical protein HRQ91_02015 [Treponema parvum]